MNPCVASKIVIAIAATEWKPENLQLAQGLPDYADMCRRRLGGQSISVGDRFQWTVGGRGIAVTIRSIAGDNEETRFKVDRKQSNLEFILERPIEETYEDELVTSLADIIRSSYDASSFQALGIPVAKAILVHGVSGVGKVTLIRMQADISKKSKDMIKYRRVSRVLQNVVFSISIHQLLALKEEIENPEWINYNPLHLIMNKAISTAPSIVIIRDLDALQSGSEKNPRILDILAREINRISNTDTVCVIGVARELRSLPDVLRKTDIFQQHFTVPIPTMPQRKMILKVLLRTLDLKPQEPIENTLDYYATQISMRTSGYVARDLYKVCRNAVLKARRPCNDVSEELAKLTIASDGEQRNLISWGDFEYALSISRPSQQMEVESSLPKRDWNDLGGYEQIKKRIRQATLTPLLRPEVFQRLGIKPPSGLLLYGPSGCGKTAFVQALASEAMMNVISVRGPEIFSKYLGETESKIRSLFATAKRIAPCIMFMDEMDAISARRGWDSSDSGGGVNERVLSTLLNEMDGVEGRQGVVVIGCTNRPDQIDDAILRPGRLDQLIYVGLPTLEDRVDIIHAIARKMAVSADVDPHKLAYQTEACSGADLESLFRRAGTIALRKNIDAPAITSDDLEEALEEVCERARRQIEEGSLVIYEKFQNDHRQ
ncbi:hypothetical protein EC973_007545 [Apophysomyces ossiformis]|uniref:AAA+ ATPase domain-containing protein n=1 Tax=Apophysomyces ossiformis TaxID=679940 RepID=A0A8H7BRP0_9FUNG|nr:hypothetical protein EC973_007545 [Apophysomyces ossiformis]